MLLRKTIAVAMTLFALEAAAQNAPVDPTDVRLYGRVMAMTDTRTLDLSLITQALSSRWQPLRAASALAIGQVGPDAGKAGVTRLRTLLNDGNSTVAANAAYALGLLRDTAS